MLVCRRSRTPLASPAPPSPPAGSSAVDLFTPLSSGFVYDACPDGSLDDSFGTAVPALPPLMVALLGLLMLGVAVRVLSMATGGDTSGDAGEEWAR